MLVLKFDKIVFHFVKNGLKYKRLEYLSNIDSIEFIRWKGIERRKNEFVFHPSKIIITLKDRSKYECNHKIMGTDKIDFKDSKGKSAVYSYFYDYRKKGRWLNSNQEDIKYPETNPHENTLVKIIFKRDKKIFKLEDLFRK